jgi:2-keto-3-deoxy-6-phosphogluconate aldolase
MQKLEAIKAARQIGGAKRGAEDVDAAAAAAAAALTEPDVERPVIQLAKKRRVGTCPGACSC